MTLRSGHGNGAGVPRVEVLPADELPAGLPDEAGTANRGDFDARGRFAAGNTVSALGGRRRAGKTRLAVRLSLGAVEADPAFAPYLRAARCFRREHCSTIARDVGGGVCGPGPSSIVASAALQLAASRFLFDLASQGQPAMFAQASRLADASRQNLLAAHELAAREAQHRAERGGAPTPWLLPASPAHDAPSRPRTTEPTTDAPDAPRGDVGAGRWGEP